MERDRIIKIKDMITKIKDKQLFKEIFYIAQSELQSTGDCKYSHNHNGIFFDLKVLSTDTLIKIEDLLKTHNNNTNTESDNNINTNTNINYNNY
jgi:hypothetical protein